MPYSTQIPDATVDLNVATPVVAVPGNQFVLNELSDSQEFTMYDVDATSATTLDSGDAITLIGSDMTTIDSGTFIGSMVYSTAPVDITLGIASVSLQVNPISASVYADGSGNAFTITDQPLDQDHMLVTLSISGLARAPVTVTVPISQAADQIRDLSILGVDVNALANTVQSTLDTVTMNLAFDPAGTLSLIDDEVVPCFVQGSIIQTQRGLVAVEDLIVGDMVVTQDHGFQPIRWIGSVKLDKKDLARRQNLWPVRISAGALGSDMPSEDLVVSPQHRILLRSKIAVRMFNTEEILVAAKHLIGAEGIDIVDRPQEVIYYHFLCDRHEVVYANGAATEAMYTGALALLAMGPDARKEIFTLFPELRDPETKWQPARPFAPGKRVRRLVSRHTSANHPLVS